VYLFTFGPQLNRNPPVAIAAFVSIVDTLDALFYLGMPVRSISGFIPVIETAFRQVDDFYQLNYREFMP
jgi:hypothetical protein